MPKLSRVRGFKYNDVVVDNYEFDIINNIYLIDVKKPAAPNKTRYDFIVPKRNGSQTFNNRFEDVFIDIVVGVYGVDIFDRRAKQRRFLEMMIDNGDLYFLDDPTLFYKAEIIDKIEVAEGEIFTQITIHLKASYCKYGEKKSINLIPGFNKIYNMGNYQAENVIEVTALTDCDSIVVSNGANSFTLQNLLTNEVVYIGSEKMIVYKIIDNVKVSAMQRFKGQFLQIKKGKSIITLSGTNYSATVKLIFNDTYIV